MKHHKGILLNKLREVFSKKEEKPQTTVAKTYGGDESSFVETVNEELKRKGIPVEKKEAQRQKDLKRFGTSMGIIDVADERPREYYRPKNLTELEEQQATDLKRYGTSEGIIEVAQTDLKRKKRDQANRCLPSNRRFTESTESDLERFGTPQGIINVATGETLEKEEWVCKPDLDPSKSNLYADTYKDFSKAQVTIRNNTPNDKEITLWGAVPEVFSGETNYQAVEQQAVSGQIPSAVHPQGMAHNPLNHVIYAVNQLSGTVTVANQQNQVVTTVQLQPSFPGLCSPVAIAVNLSPASVHYGYAYVACSVSNTVQVISPAHEVVATIPVGCRPIAIAFNPANNSVYVANLVDNTISVIDAETHALIASPLEAGNGPIGIGVNPANGQLFVCNSVSNTISVYGATHTLIATINNAGQRPVSVTYNPANGYMYAVANYSNEILKISPASHIIEAHIPAGNKPYSSFFVPLNQFLYVQNRQDNTLTVIRADNSLVATVSLGEQNIGSVFNPDNNTIYVTDTPNNRINTIGFGSANNGISISPDYTEIQADFKSNFAILQHVRFVVSGPERLHSFRLNRFNATGTTSTRRFSFENYASPMHGLNVSEFIALAGSMIDARMNWKFMLPGFHTVSVLIWYKQFKVQELLPDLKNKPKNK